MGIFLTLIAVLVPLLIIPGLPEPYITAKVLVLIALLDIGYLGAIVVRLRQKSLQDAQLGSGVFGLMVRALLVVWLVLLGALSVRGEYLGWGSLLRANGWWIWLHVLVVGTDAVLLLTDVWRTRLLRVIASMGVVVAILGWIGKVAPGLPWIGVTGSMVSTMGNASFLAGYLLVTLGVTGVMYTRTRAEVRGWWIVGAIVQMSAIIATDSRAGLLGLVCGLMIAGVWMVLHMPKPRGRIVGGILALFLTVFVAVQFAPASWNLPRAVQIAPSAVTSQTRLLQWSIAWNAMREEPMGWGRGAYPEVFASQFDPASLVHVGSEAFNDDAHNTLLMVGVETGIAGMIIWGMLYLAAAVLAWRVSPWAAAMVGAYCVYLFFTPEQPVVASIFWISFASIVAVPRTIAMPVTPKQLRGSHRLVVVVTGIIAVVGGVVWTTHASAFASYGAAEQARASGRWFPWMDIVTKIGNDEVPASCQLWEKAMQTWIAVAGNAQMPEDIRVRTAQHLEKRADACTENQQRFYRTYLLAQYYGQQAVRNGNEWIVRAQDMFARAQSLAPRHPYPGYAEGQFLIEINRVPDAIVRLEQVRAAEPDVRETYVYLYLAYRMAADTEHAEEIKQEGLKRGVVFPAL